MFAAAWHECIHGVWGRRNPNALQIMHVRQLAFLYGHTAPF